VNSSDLVNPDPNPELPMSTFSESEIVLSTSHRLRNLQDPRELSLRSQLRSQVMRFDIANTINFTFLSNHQPLKYGRRPN
jgi:hypothetical protein